jgi:hypothetical protein
MSAADCAEFEVSNWEDVQSCGHYTVNGRVRNERD